MQGEGRAKKPSLRDDCPRGPIHSTRNLQADLYCRLLRHCPLSRPPHDHELLELFSWRQREKKKKKKREKRESTTNQGEEKWKTRGEGTNFFHRRERIKCNLIVMDYCFARIEYFLLHICFIRNNARELRNDSME